MTYEEKRKAAIAGLNELAQKDWAKNITAGRITTPAGGASIETGRQTKNAVTLNSGSGKVTGQIKRAGRGGQALTQATAIVRDKKARKAADAITAPKRNAWQFRPDGSRKSFDELSNSEVFTWISSLPKAEQAATAQQFEAEHLKNPGSKRYDPYYTDYSNNDEARQLFGVNVFDQDWIDNNRGYLNQLTFTDENYTSPKKPGKYATDEEKKAYAYWQIANTYEETTRNAEAEYEQLRADVKEQIDAFREQGLYSMTGRSLTADEIIQGIDWSEYKTLQNMREASYAGNGRMLNRPVRVGDESIRAMVNAALRGEDITENKDYVWSESEHLGRMGSVQTSTQAAPINWVKMYGQQQRAAVEEAAEYARKEEEKAEKEARESGDGLSFLTGGNAQTSAEADGKTAEPADGTGSGSAEEKNWWQRTVDWFNGSGDADKEHASAGRYALMGAGYADMSQSAQDMMGVRETEIEQLAEAAAELEDGSEEQQQVIDRMTAMIEEDETISKEAAAEGNKLAGRNMILGVIPVNSPEVIKAGVQDVNARFGQQMKETIGQGLDSAGKMLTAMGGRDQYELAEKAAQPKAVEMIFVNPLEKNDKDAAVGPNMPDAQTLQQIIAEETRQKEMQGTAQWLLDEQTVKAFGTTEIEEVPEIGYNEVVGSMRATNGLESTRAYVMTQISNIDLADRTGLSSIENRKLDLLRMEYQDQLNLLNDERAAREEIEERTLEGLRNINIGNGRGPMQWLWNRGYNDAVSDGDKVPLEDYEEYLRYRLMPGVSVGDETVRQYAEMQDYDQYGHLEAAAGYVAAGVAEGIQKGGSWATKSLEEVMYYAKSKLHPELTREELYATDGDLSSIRAWNSMFEKDIIPDEVEAKMDAAHPVMAFVSDAMSEIIKMSTQGYVSAGIADVLGGVPVIGKLVTATSENGLIRSMGLQNAPFVLDAFTGGVDTARQAGANDDQAFLAGVLNGAIVGPASGYTVDKLGQLGGKLGASLKNLTGSRAAQTAAQQGAQQAAAKGWGQTVLQLGKDLGKAFLSEGTEEALEEPIQGLIAKAVYDPDRAWVGEGGVFDPAAMGQSFVMGGFIGGCYAVLGGLSGVLGKPAQTKAEEIMELVESGETVTPEGTQKLKEDVEELTGIEEREAAIQDRMLELSEQGDAPEVVQAQQEAMRAQEALTGAEERAQAAQAAFDEAAAAYRATQDEFNTGTLQYTDVDRAKAALEEMGKRIPDLKKDLDDANQELELARAGSEIAEQAWNEAIDQQAQAIREQATAEVDAARAQQAQTSAETSGKKLTPGEQKEAEKKAYADAEAAVTDREATMDGALKQEKTITPGVKRNFAGMTTAAQEKQLQILDALGQKYGLQFDIVDDIEGANAKYAGGRTITVSMNAIDQAYVQAGVHEMVHYVKAASSDGYALLEATVLNELKKNEAYDLEAAISERMDEYGADREGAIEEIVAEAIPALFADENAVRHLVQQDRSLAQKIRDFFVEFARELRRIALSYGADNSRDEVIASIANADAGVDTLMEYAAVLDDALEMANSNAADMQKETKLSKQTASDGTQYVEVDVDQEQFDGLDSSQRTKLAAQIIKTRFAGKVIGRTDNAAFVNGRTAGEYSHPATKIKSEEMHDAKMRASTELDHLLEVAEYIGHNPDDGRHPKATGGWDHYRTIFKAGGRFYRADVSIMLTDKGRLFYDVTKIREQLHGPLAQSESDSPDHSRNEDAPNISIPDFEADVNSGTKYSLIADSNQTHDELLTGMTGMTHDELIETERESEKGEAQSDIQRRAGRVAREYKSGLERAQIVAGMNEMVDAYQKGQEGESSAQAIADRLARDIIEKSVNIDRSHREQYEGVINHLKTAGISLTDVQKQEVASERGSYNDWRMSVFGAVKVKNDARSLDSQWEELSQMAPEYFPADTNEAQMPGKLSEFVQAMRPKYVNPYDMDTGSAAADLSMRLQADVLESLGRTEEAAVLTGASDAMREKGAASAQEKQRARKRKWNAESRALANEIYKARESGDDAALSAALSKYRASRRATMEQAVKADAIEIGVQARRARTEVRRLNSMIDQYTDQINGDDSDVNKERLVEEKKRLVELREQMRQQAIHLHRQQVFESSRAQIEGLDEAISEEPKDSDDIAAEIESGDLINRALNEDMADEVEVLQRDIRARNEALADRMRNKRSMADYNQTSTIPFEELVETFSDLQGAIVQAGELSKVWEARRQKAEAMRKLEERELASLRRQLKDAREKGDADAVNTLNEAIVRTQDRIGVLTSQEKLSRAQGQYTSRLGAESLEKALREGRLPQPIMEYVMAIVANSGRTGRFNQNVIVKAGETLRENATFAIRVWDDLFGEYAPLMRAIYYDPVMDNETDRQRWIAQWRARIEELKLTPEESKLVQMYGEGVVPDGVEVSAHVIKAAQVFREFYDESYALANNAMKRNGYDEIHRIGSYFPHLDIPRTFLEKLGITDTERGGLPTGISGLTETFNPGRQYSGHMQERKGPTTDYDALYGFEEYIATMSGVIFHTDDIQRHRQLESDIRTAAKANMLQNQVDVHGQVFDQNHFVNWLHEYANLLAGKKSQFDRGGEGTAGRVVYNVLNSIKRLRGAGAVMGNISSAITNTVPMTQIIAEHPVATIKAIGLSAHNWVKGRGNQPESQFRIRKFGSDSVVHTWYTRVSDKAGRLFNIVDAITTDLIVNAYYIHGMDMGMDSETAMRSADTKAARLMGDRSRGAQPNIYSSQLMGFLTQFQLEVANQSQHYRKDIWKEKGARGALGTIAMTAIWGYLYNELMEKIIGRRIAADPIKMGVDMVKAAMNDGGALPVAQSAFNNVGEMFPYMGGGRIAAFEPLEGFMEAVLSGDWGDIAYEARDLAAGYVPMGGQINKSLKGAEALVKGGVYNAGGTQLRYAVDNTSAATLVQALVFGPTSLATARDYYDGEAPGLTKSQTENYELGRERGMTSTEAYENEAARAKAGKLQDEADKAQKAADKAEGLREAGVAEEDIQDADTSKVEEQREEAKELRSKAIPTELIPDAWADRTDEPAMQNAIRIWQITGKDWSMPEVWTQEKSYTISGETVYAGKELAEAANREYAARYEELMRRVPDPDTLTDEQLEELKNALSGIRTDINDIVKDEIKKRGGRK